MLLMIHWVQHLDPQFSERAGPLWRRTAIMTHVDSMITPPQVRQHLVEGRSANIVGFGDNRYLVLNTRPPSLRWAWWLNLWRPWAWQPMNRQTLL